MNIWSTNTYYGSGILVIGSDNNLYRSLSKNIGLDPTTHSDIWQAESSEGTPITPSGGGGSSAGSPIVRKFPFAFDTPGILTGAALYTPTIGDILLDAWFQIDTAWNGTTPFGDLGMFTHGTTSGLYLNANGAVDMTNPDTTQGNLSLLFGQGSSMTLLAAGVVGATTMGAGYRQAPAKFLTVDPIKVCVSQNGAINGTDPGSTQGAAILYLVTVTPT